MGWCQWYLHVTSECDLVSISLWWCEWCLHFTSDCDLVSTGLWWCQWYLHVTLECHFVSTGLWLWRRWLRRWWLRFLMFMPNWTTTLESPPLCDGCSVRIFAQLIFSIAFVSDIPMFK